MAREMKVRPTYAISSVDHALLLATMLQLEGRTTVSEAAERLGIARSTAHRLLSMLVYRDFAVRDESHAYHPGPVLELAAHSRSDASRLRSAALPDLHALAEELGESTNLIVRTGGTARFIASVEGRQALRVGNREGMVFPAHRVTGGLLLLAEMSADEVDAFCAGDVGERLDPVALQRTLARIRRQGFAVNKGSSERGVVAVGVLVRHPDGTAAGGISVSMPSGRYDQHRLSSYVAALRRAAARIEVELGRG